MEANEVKLRQYITEVAMVEQPVLRLLLGLQRINNGEIPEDATLGSVVSYYLDKIDNLAELAKTETQENYDAVYEQFASLLQADTDEEMNKMDDNE